MELMILNKSQQILSQEIVISESINLLFSRGIHRTLRMKK